jgi:hypothetical protein
MEIGNFYPSVCAETEMMAEGWEGQDPCLILLYSTFQEMSGVKITPVFSFKQSLHYKRVIIFFVWYVDQPIYKIDKWRKHIMMARCGDHLRMQNPEFVI